MQRTQALGDRQTGTRAGSIRFLHAADPAEGLKGDRDVVRPTYRSRCRPHETPPLSGDDLDRFGYTPNNGPPPGSGQTRPWTNKRTAAIVRVPVGIDPGFQHNPGLTDLGADAANRMIGKIDRATPALARAAIGKPWKTAIFQRHLEGRSNGDWPVAIARTSVTEAIGARSATIRLSGESAAKQTSRHPDLNAQDYARVQTIIDDGELYDVGDRRTAGFLEEGDRIWRAVVKTTEDGSETYLVSLHRARTRDLAMARKRLGRIGT